MLRIEDLWVSYGHVQALSGVSLEVKRGSIVSIIGSNGAGKSTLLNTISGLVKQERGKIFLWDGTGPDTAKLLPREPYRVVKLGVVQVPEGRQVFAGLTVRENLMAGAYTVNDAGRVRRNLDRMFEMYPILKERARQQAGTLSGGEQQMLAICRGLMAEPKVLLLDEPSLGLAPIIVKGVFDTVRRIRDEGITVVLVEQNANQALAIADYAYVLENGRVVLEGAGRSLLCDPAVKDAYLGGAQEA
ncbi:amino acid/amide ABC transporter ATP-binding protein 2 (HAAT family) [Aminivibrio pyruvatiphilus]|uniref:Amino acid/amide ABC transporter ATP-binding protein 2 (HAAT family) n=1 Tax=Aminivibrio pyruvatiphilus TaxID=1005740 RepID=A0A4R8MGI7_9BACT|nr:ABC transporter ATP-binding protein [Aminivibrio pyruvatiphilus]TDY63076.1 amino acid/amide ABC transporter ATP-binding protein 2 (HAAT family) [Aminivibrio pyruvatiphilus]